MKVSVTEQDVREGARLHCQLCPVARALSRAFGNAYYSVSVGPLGEVRCVARNTSGVDWYELPPAAQAWVEQFDRGVPMPPIEFELPPNSHRERPAKK